MVNPPMPWVADFRDMITLFPFPSLKNLAEGNLEGHFGRFPTQTGCCQHQRLPWLCLNNCMEFSSFQTRIPVQELHFSIVVKMLFLLSDTNLPHHCPFFYLTSVALIFVTPHLYIEAIYNFDLLCCTLLDLF